MRVWRGTWAGVFIYTDHVSTLHLDVGEVLQRLVEEVSHDAAQHGLVAHQQHVTLRRRGIT